MTLAKFEQSIAVLVVQCRYGRLCARYQDELFSILEPSDILNHVLEDGHVLSVTSSKYLNVLKAVLSIVALASRVSQVLRPDESSVPC